MFALCESPRNKALIETCVKQHTEHKRHITGEGYKALVTFHEGYETDRQKKIKESMSKPATLPITKIIIDELNRWTNSQGTYKAYSFSSKQKEQGFIKSVLSQVWRGRSMDDFITNEYKEALDIEFSSFLTVVKPKIFEVDGKKWQDREGIKSRLTDKYPRPYIIFTSMSDVRDFLVYGNKVEYLIIKYMEVESGDGEKVTYYRAMDDEKDVIIVFDKTSGKYILAPEYEVIETKLGFVPSIQISTLKQDILIDGARKSQITFLIPSLDRYLALDAEHIQSEIVHGHPQRWSVAQKCPVCDGDGEVINDPDKAYYQSDVEDGSSISCPRCGGKGSIITTDSNETVALPQFDQEGKPYPLEAPAGYVNFNTDILDHQAQELTKLANDIIYAGTSNKNIVADRFKTATESNSNTKTLEDKIDDRLKVIEEIETFLTNTAAKLDDEYSSGYGGCSIKYGRNLYYRNENDILLEVRDGKIAGMPMAYIKSLIIELYKTKYRNSQAERERYLRLTELEPFPGYTVEELVKMEFPADPFDINFKLNFNDLIELYERQYGDILNESIEKVSQKLVELNQKKYGKAKQAIQKSEGGQGDV